ncbi:MAG: exopolysaccharide biosynthesis polyprenyl glycosylphosphotransferase [Clostridia bacterium]|nr:exopolysaccharide biosynthesis polyprenyl glycosylphosphotransferase [Clostridia bacterium]
MNKKQNKQNIFRFVSSFFIVSIYTVLFYLILFFGYNKIFEAPLDSGGYLMVVLYCFIMTFILRMMGAFRIGYNKKLNIILSHIIGIGFVNVLSYLQLSLINRAFLPVLYILMLTVVEIAFSVGWTYIAFIVNKKYFSITELLLVYGDKKAEDIVYKILEREDQYRICETVHYEGQSLMSDDNLVYVKDCIKRYHAVIIYRLESSVRNDLLKFCYDNDIEVFLPPRISDVIIRGAKSLDQFDSPLIVCRNCSLTDTQRLFKRIFDVFASFFGLVILAPVMAAIAIAIKAYDGGPVLFKQKRVTRNEKVFEIYKFRSMIVDAEKDNKSVPATDNDPRITPVGAIIRKLRLDELPQLFNILKGDMSLVGPRPERVEHHNSYSQQIPEFPFRTKVKAGLTGYAQIMGKYNTTPYDKLLLDLEYIQKFSFFLDFRLILLTVKILFMKESTEGFKKTKGDDNK